MNDNIKLFPAPWNLKGEGYIFLYKFKKEFVREQGNVPKFLSHKFIGGFGSVMLVDYKESNAGPYSELLFIPGKFNFKNKKLDTISKIYVSTNESVKNGRLNWGIPKELADFSFSKTDSNTEKVVVSKDGKIFAQFTLKSKKVKFPVNTKLLPFPLVEKYENNYYFTNFSGKGKGVISKIIDMKIDKEYFPDVSSIKPIAVIKVNPFDITFPKAVKYDNYGDIE